MIEKLGTAIPMPAIAIVGEPTSMQIVTGHKGIRGFETMFTGVAAHSSAPHQGVNAIVHAAAFIAFLHDLAGRTGSGRKSRQPVHTALDDLQCRFDTRR